MDHSLRITDIAKDEPGYDLVYFTPDKPFLFFQVTFVSVRNLIPFINILLSSYILSFFSQHPLDFKGHFMEWEWDYLKIGLWLSNVPVWVTLGRGSPQIILE